MTRWKKEDLMIKIINTNMTIKTILKIKQIKESIP